MGFQAGMLIVIFQADISSHAESLPTPSTFQNSYAPGCVEEESTDDDIRQG